MARPSARSFPTSGSPPCTTIRRCRIRRWSWWAGASCGTTSQIESRAQRLATDDAHRARLEAEDLIWGVGAHVVAADEQHVVQRAAGEIEPPVGAEAESIRPAQAIVLEQRLQGSI